MFFVIHLAIRYNINCKCIKSANVDPGRKGGGKEGEKHQANKKAHIKEAKNSKENNERKKVDQFIHY